MKKMFNKVKGYVYNKDLMFWHNVSNSLFLLVVLFQLI